MRFTTRPGFTARQLQQPDSVIACPSPAVHGQQGRDSESAVHPLVNTLSRALPWYCGSAFAEDGSIAVGATGMLEPKTGAQFPAQFCQMDGTHCGTLQGVGARSKKIAGIKTVNVYSVGLFVDPAAAKTALKAFKGMSPEKLAKDQKFFDALVSADDVEKTLHLNIAFGRISSSQFWDAIEGQLAGPMKQLGAEADLKAFAATFDGVKFRKGLPISFCISEDGGLSTKIDEKFASAIYSKSLCRSLLGIYLGASPVSPDAKASIGTGLATLITTEDPPAEAVSVPL